MIDTVLKLFKVVMKLFKVVMLLITVERVESSYDDLHYIYACNGRCK